MIINFVLVTPNLCADSLGLKSNSIIDRLSLFTPPTSGAGAILTFSISLGGLYI